MATGQELTLGQNAWSRGEEGNHAMATGQELTPGQNASLDIRCEQCNSLAPQYATKVSPQQCSDHRIIGKYLKKFIS